MTPLEALKKLAELQKDATPGPMSVGSREGNGTYDVASMYGVTTQPTEDGLGQNWVYILAPQETAIRATPEQKLSLAKLFAQSGSTDFAALADYVEGLQRENSTLRNIAARDATIAECGE